jgi:hypothetical protein
MATGDAEFPPSVRRLLAECAGYRCSVPFCNALTVGCDGKSSVVINLNRSHQKPMPRAVRGQVGTVRVAQASERGRSIVPRA